MRSTQEWEKALEGTTPPQWEAKQYGHEWIVVQAPVTTDAGREGYGNLRYVADVYGAENAHLSALAPEAVAEVVRLRRELEAQLSYINRNLEHEGVETHEDLDPFGWSMQEYGELSEQINQRDFLIRILEGES